MRINDKIFPGSKDPTSGISKVDRQDVQQRVKKAGPPERNDKVDISARAKQIARLTEELNHLPEVRDAKVQQIKKMVESGTYRIDPGRIAERLIEEL